MGSTKILLVSLLFLFVVHDGVQAIRPCPVPLLGKMKYFWPWWMPHHLPPAPTPTTPVDASTQAPRIAPTYASTPIQGLGTAPTYAPPPRMAFDRYYCVDFEVPNCHCAFYDDGGHLTCHD